MALTTLMLQKIKEELQNDPNGVGYAGMTKAQKIAALNNPVQKVKQIEYSEQSPISRILSGVAFTPNIIDSTDFDAALAAT